MGVGKAGESGGGKMETTVFEHQLKKSKKKITHGHLDKKNNYEAF